MTRHRVSCGSRRSKGFSLIELMVSLVIGLLISAAAFSAYLGASDAAKMAEAQERMNEDAQAALSILTQQLRMAGNNPKRSNRVDNASTPTLSSLRDPVYLPTPTYAGFTTTSALYAFAIRGCNGTFSAINTASSLDNLTCTGGTSTQPDSIAISYEADKFNTLPTGSSLPTDCLGNGLSTITSAVASTATTTGTVTYAVADNRFYIGTSTAILSPSLYCKGNGDKSIQQPLVENIEDLQFTYGAVSPSTPAASFSTAQVAGYLTADQVAALSTVPNDPAPWAKIMTVRICVLVRSEGPVVSDPASTKYLACDGTVSAVQSDRRLRRAYSTTVVLRNRRR